MRRKRLKLSAVILLGLGLTGLQAQTMQFKETSGLQIAYSLNTISKLSFASGNVIVQKTSGSMDLHALANLRYMIFTDSTTGLSETEQTTAEVNVFPNPVDDVLNIQLSSPATSSGTIEIITMEGKIVRYHVINSKDTFCRINVINLPKGMYICRVNNETNFKTTKFIKQ